MDKENARETSRGMNRLRITLIQTGMRILVMWKTQVWVKLREDAVELGQKTAIDRKSSSVLFKVAGWFVDFSRFCGV